MKEKASENEYLAQYQRNKTETLAFLDAALAALNAWGREEAARPLSNKRRNVRDGLFSIVLVGEFSAGKSTFLNALMRRRILPSFKAETTATVNFLRHISQAPNGVCGQVYYRDGSVRDLPDLELSTIEQVVSTRGDRDDVSVAASVERVDLFLDSDFLKDGVMLVDSPGLNGVADRHREITEQQIQASHASIFLFNCDQPGSQTNFEYLRELKNKTDNIFFVLNKIDVLNIGDLDTPEGIIRNLQQSYKKKFPEEKTLPKIWPIAAYPALAARNPEPLEYHDRLWESVQDRDRLERLSRIEDFEDRLWRYLTKGERARDELCEPIQSALNAIQEARRDFEEQLKMLADKANGEDLRKQQETLQTALDDLRRSRKSASPQIVRKVNDAIKNMRESAEAEGARYYEAVKIRLEECETPDDLQEFARKLSREIDNRFAQMGVRFDERLREELLLVVSEEYQEYLDELDERLGDSVTESERRFHSAEIIVENISTGVNLKEFDEKCQELQDKIDALEDEITRGNLQRVQARRAERERKACQDALRELEASRQCVYSQFTIPNVDVYNKVENRKEWRGGLVGVVTTALFGKKTVSYTTEVRDSTARDEALAERQRELDKIEALKMEERARLEQIAVGQSSEELESRILEDTKKRDKLEERLVEIEKKFTETLERNNRKVCRRIRNEILASLDQTILDVNRQMTAYLTAQEKNYLNSVRELINMSLDEEISRTQKQLENTVQLLQTEGVERDKKNQELTEALQSALELMERGIALHSKLQSEMRDHVEQEAV